MKITLAFDVYGTLMNTHGVVSLLEGFIGSKAKIFSQTWRDKQLEYSFRKALMNQYEDFSICTKQALDFTCLFYEIELTEDQKTKLLNFYKSLPLFEDVKEGLDKLTDSNVDLYAFSNGKRESIEALLSAAGISEYFKGIVSADTIKSFKPKPGVYEHFISQSQADLKSTWLISSNPFDILGAHAYGFKTAWIQRNDHTPFDPWGISPSITLSSLSTLYENIY